MSDYCGQDWDDAPSQHTLSVDDVIKQIERFFASQSDQLGSFVAMIRRRQQEGETCAHFAAELRRMVRFTVFGSMDRDVSEAVVCGVFVAGLSSDDWRQKVLKVLE